MAWHSTRTPADGNADARASSSTSADRCRQNGDRSGGSGAPTCFPCCTASLSLSLDEEEEVVVVADEPPEPDGRNTFLTAANQPPPAACFFPMPACPRACSACGTPSVLTVTGGRTEHSGCCSSRRVLASLLQVSPSASLPFGLARTSSGLAESTQKLFSS